MGILGSKKKKSGAPNKLMQKGTDIAKKALSTPIKIAITTFIATILLWVLVVVLLAGIFFSLIVGITNFRGEGEDTTPPVIGDGSCPCGCIWLPNTTTDGNYGYTTGTLSNSTLGGQIINTINYINDKTGYKLEPYMIFGIPAVEIMNSNVPECLYDPGVADIFTSLMEDHNSVGANGAFEDGDIKNGKLVMVRGKYLGPFQITPKPDYKYAIMLPDADIVAIGGTVPTDITNRNIKGQIQSNPLYLPDVIYGLNMYYDSATATALKYFNSNASVIGLDGWDTASDSAKQMLAYGHSQIRYHGGGIKTAESNTIIFKFMWDFVRVVESDGISAFDSVPRNSNGVWSQTTSNTSKTMEEICRIVESKYGYNYYTDWQAYGGSKSDYKVDWIYMPKIVYSGMSAVTRAGGTVQTGASSSPNTSTASQLDWSKTLFIGDSLTVGMGNSTSLSESGAVIEAQIGSHIKLDSKDSSGKEVLSAYTRAANYKDVSTVVIAIGSNDFGSNTFESDYQKLIDLIKTNNPSAQVYMNTLPPVNNSAAKSSGYTCTNADMADKGEIIKTLAQKNNATLIDIYTELLSADNQLDPKYSNDGLHLSSEGYREWWDLIRTTLEGQGKNSSASDTPITEPNDANGHWVCSCDIPCPYCSCHDLPTNEPTDGQGGQSRVFPEEKPGEASGLWGTTEELQAAIGDLGDAGLKAKLNTLIKYMGQAPGYTRKYTPDKFMGPDGHGIICYGQTTSGIYGEQFAGLQYSPGNGTFASSGCGTYSFANALSTLEKKWITPPEVAIALNTISKRTGVNVAPFSGSVVTFYGMQELLKEAGYKYELFNTNDYESTVTLSDGTTGKLRDVFDDCFNQGGLMIDVFKYPLSYSDGGAHYVVVAGKDSTGNYQVINSNPPRSSAPTGAGPFSYSELKEYTQTNSTGVLLIYPKYTNSTSNSTVPPAVNPLLGLAGTGTWVYSSDVFRGGGDMKNTAHAGVDMTLGGSANTVGKPVYAMFDGEAVFNSGMHASSMGHYVVLKHTFAEGTFYTLYQHLARNTGIAKGTTVKAGDIIGTAGGTGSKTIGSGGNKVVVFDDSAFHVHLHVEVIMDPGPNFSGKDWGVSNKIDVDAGRVIGGKPKIQNSQLPISYEPTSPFDLTQMKVKYTGKMAGISSLKLLTVVKQGVDYGDMIIRYNASIGKRDNGVNHGLRLQ